MTPRNFLQKPVTGSAAPTSTQPRAIVAGDTRFLAFAFADSDLVVEFDENWQILYGMGLSANGPEQVRARSLADLVDAASLGVVMPLQGQLGPNKRSASAEVLLKTPSGLRHATMRAFRARELGARISCVFTYGAEIESDAPETTAAAAAPATAILTAEDFLDQTAHVLENPRSFPGRMCFTFVELTKRRHNDEAQATSPALAKILIDLELLLLRGSIGGAVAGRIGEGRYVMLTDSRVSLENLNKAIDSLGAGIPALLGPRTSQSPVTDLGSPETSVRALRFAMETFAAKEGNPDLAILAAELTSTLKHAGEFRVAVQDRSFKLVYQPVMRLADEKVHVFEALLRLPGKETAGASIRMAEQLGLIDKLDVAVAEQAWGVLERDRTRELAIAINISGGALRDDAYIQGLIGMTKRAQSLRNRFTIEITERAALEDLEMADRRVQALRRMGFRVCVDDFGAGAASFDYLRALNIDSIKIDGRYVRDLATSERSRTLVKHFVRLCGVMEISTIGAHTETRAAAEALKALGVDYAQGWYYGQPVDEPRTIDPSVSARRKGETEVWQ
jgi:EAL domain-containing protein (putative c-di-GMP-specific phosphodiesterase class I)